MFFAALATDIKKSSTIWANLPTWMLLAVNRTNNITEYIINMTKKDNITQYILPNSPEGDAWTVMYSCEDQEELKKHVKHVAHFLKYTYSLARKKGVLSASDDAIEDELNEKYPNQEDKVEKGTTREFIDSEPFFNAIYVRVGVAFSDVAPIKYTYNAKTIFEDADRSDEYTSYWESVIKESERAEAEGPWETGIGITQAGEIVKAVKATPEENTFEVTIEGQKLKLEELVLDDSGLVYNAEKYNIEKVNGFMIFVHYHLHITMEDVKEHPHLYEPLVHEFETVHLQTVKTFNEVFKNKAMLVKVKRSSDSMFYIPPIAPSSVWNYCLSICAALPVGSSIGIAFTNSNFKNKEPTGMLKRLTSIRPGENGAYKQDYFGDCVNLSARMDTFEWKYPTKLFTTGNNSHFSRVAMCCADNKSGWNWWHTSKQTNNAYPGGKTARYMRPFLQEDIPRPYLNAGKENETLRVISAHVYQNSNLQPGDVVWWEDIEKKTKSGRRMSVTRLPGEDVDIGKPVRYYGRIKSVNFLFVEIEKMNKYNWPNDETDTITRNITYLNKLTQEELEPEAEKLPEVKKESIYKRVASLKF